MSKIKLTGSNSGYVEISSAADAGNLTLSLPTAGTALLSNAGNVFTGITTFTGVNITDDITFNGASYNVVWDKSDNQLEFGDNAKLSFGASSDMQLYHDGNHSYIDDSGTGNLRLRSGTLEIQNLAGNKTSAIFSSGGGQTLNFNNSTKFVTTNTGAVVTGILTASNFITGVSNLHNLGLTLSSGQLDIGSNIKAGNAGVVTATAFHGSGANLTNLPPSAPVGGASTNQVFFENDKLVEVGYQITSTKNAMSAGPISVSAGIAVTIPSGCSWTIV